MYCVYVHTFPDGKIYIGQTQNANRRWYSPESYKSNSDMYSAIKKYGWDNIKHEIICLVNSKEEAEEKEKLYIVWLDAENPSVGYNKTHYKEGLRRQYVSREEYKNDILWEEYKPIWAKQGFSMSIPDFESLADSYIYNKRNRIIYKKKCIDGFTYAKLCEEFNLSIRQLKRIISNCNQIIKEHL